ncbi:mfs monocarboxylate transporter [Ophiostoma piceae UAMH 11346]|uniref:Mfs monocarboxylate transporter n=1 Tax=Ophiostoma piceae (strain UAMH 11346) TaxID=1262450 RepID=S3DA68_OPHP1|nr:mfs monocarboxylate transporter [Ophiostoma piceae UAMH 11346]
MSIELDRIRLPAQAAGQSPRQCRNGVSNDLARRSSQETTHSSNSHQHQHQQQQQEEQPPQQYTADGRPIPPPDHGRAAYLVLAACSLVQAPVWGYSLAFGVFREYYATHSLLDASPGSITSIGTTQTGIMYLAVPFVMSLLTRFPRLRPWCGPLGLLVSVASLAGSSAPGASESTSAAPLIATQGVLYALGCALLFGSASLCLDDWFVDRKGFAYGVMWAAKSTVGGGMPLLVAVLLARYGVETTLRAWAIASALLSLPVLFFLRPRVPPSAVDVSNNGTPNTSTSSLVFFRRPLFWMLMVGNIIQSLGYQIPNTYLSSYAVSLGLEQSTTLSTYAGPLLIALFSVASVPGTIVMGMLGDRMPATRVVLISSTGSAISVFTLWYVSDLTSFHGSPLAILIAFALAYGFFAGGFSSTWSAVLHDMKKRDEAVNTGLVFGMLMGGRGLGFVLSGPVSGALLAAAASNHNSKSTSAVVGEYAPLILCTGMTAILGAWGSLWSLGKPCRRLARRMVSLYRGY